MIARILLLGLLAAAPADDSAPAIGQVGGAAGSGTYPAIAEGRTDAPGYTIYRPAKLPHRPLPLVLWGNGGCRNDGMSASHFLREIASHGYVVIANGAARQERAPSPPAPPPGATPDETSVAQLLEAIDWAERASADPRNPLYRRIDTQRIAAMGHSCGGLQALAAGADPRIDTVVAFASGVYIRPGSGRSGVSITKDDLKKLHTPIAYVLGGPQDIAYPNGSDDFARIAHVPALLASQPVGHGGTFDQPDGGDWAIFATAWLDWQLKRDAKATAWFVGPRCTLCTNPRWTIQRKQFPEQP